MATTPTKPDIPSSAPFSGAGAPAWPRGQSAGAVADAARDHDFSDNKVSDPDQPSQKPSQRDALQALLAFSALHEQVRRRKALATKLAKFDGDAYAPGLKTNFEAKSGAAFELEFEKDEQFILDEVLQLVAERAVAITGADGLAIALAENNEVVLRASAGTIRPDVGARIDRDSAFSGACFCEAQVVTCDDTETDQRVNLQACRTLGARSMVAVPLCGRRRVIGVLEAFSSWPFAFNESDVRNLSLLAELVLGALKPEDEDRFAQSAQVAATKLEVAPRAVAPAVFAPLVVAVAPPVAPPLTPTPTVASTAPLPIVTNEVEKNVEAKIVEKKIENKPIAPEVKTAASHGILDTPAVLDEPTSSDTLAETTPEIGTSVANETEIESPIIFAQPTDSAGHKPFLLVLLACIVIGTVVAGGIWWRMKTTQIGSDMIRTESTAAKPAESSPKEAVSTPEPAAATPTSAANLDADTITDDTDPNRSPATAQELSKFPRVTGVRHWSSADASTVVLDLEDQVQYEAHRLAGPDRIYFDLHDTRLVPDLVGKPIDVGDALLSRIRVSQPV
jgi:putative methionine-R-sulfoxide reductase with GAF domain